MSYLIAVLNFQFSLNFFAFSKAYIYITWFLAVNVSRDEKLTVAGSITKELI